MKQKKEKTAPEVRWGSVVEYNSITGKRRATVIAVKKDGKLVLCTKTTPGNKTGLSKNVCVKQHRIKVIEF